MIAFLLPPDRRAPGGAVAGGVTPSRTRRWRATHLARAARSVLSSLFLTALAQSGVATAGYLIARVPHAVFSGCSRSWPHSFLRSAPPSSRCPLALLMLRSATPGRRSSWRCGAPGRGLIDNVVKPLLIQGGVQLDAAVLFFALIGGLALFGAVGLIVGPLAVALFVAVVTRPAPEESRSGGGCRGTGDAGCQRAALISPRPRPRSCSVPCCAA